MIKDKNILITGGNSGIGFFTTINLLKTQNNLYIPIRSLSRKEEFLLKLIKYFDKEYIEKYLNLIDNIDLGDAYKWKIAFLYSNFNVLNIFKKEIL